LRRRGISTVIGLLLLVIIVTVFLSSLYTIMNSYQELFRSFDERARFLIEKRGEELSIVRMELDLDNTLVVEVKNVGSVTTRIVTIWVNDTYSDLSNASVILVPGDTTRIDTNCTVEVDKEYVVKLVTERGSVFTAYIPVTPPVARWENLPNAPEILPPGSVVFVDEEGEVERYYPSSYTVIHGELESGTLEDLTADDGRYMIFLSRPRDFASTLFAHSETWTLGGAEFYTFRTRPADGPGYLLNASTTVAGWIAVATFVYPLNNTYIPSDTWTFYYRGYYSISGSYWRYRRAITITERTGYTLTDYQVKIVLTPDNFDYSKAAPDGSDIRFTDSDGLTELSYWIERWDPGGESIIWVKVPEIPGGGTKVIYMYYGNPKAESRSNLLEVMESLPAYDGPGYKLYYQEWVMPVSGLIGGGKRMGWRADDWQWKYYLPFAFPYYSGVYTRIAVASNGYIEVNGVSGWSDPRDSTAKLKLRKYICPLWEDLMTNYPRGADIFITKNYRDEFGRGVVIRWYGCFYYRAGVVNFEVVLYSNGLIRFNYGHIDGRWYDKPTVGISFGDLRHYTVSSYNNHPADWYDNRNSLLFWPRKKAYREPTVSIGAEEYLPIAKFAVTIKVLRQDGSVSMVIGERVAEATAPMEVAMTVYGSYTIAEDYYPEPGEYLAVDYEFYIFAYGDYNATATLIIDDSTLPPEDQTRLEASTTSPFPTSYMVKVEFVGYAELGKPWAELVWTFDSSYTRNGVDVTLQLFNYVAGEYPTAGDGYIRFVYTVAPEDYTASQRITRDPERFRDPTTGEWKVMFTALVSTDFNAGFFKARVDVVEYMVKVGVPPPVRVRYLYIGVFGTGKLYRYDPVTGSWENLRQALQVRPRDGLGSCPRASGGVRAPQRHTWSR